MENTVHPIGTNLQELNTSLLKILRLITSKIMIILITYQKSNLKETKGHLLLKVMF